MKPLFTRTIPLALAAVFVVGAGTAVAQSSPQVCRNTMRGVGVCDVAKEVARQTAAQLVPSTDTSAPAKPGEAMRYTEVFAQDNRVVMKGRMLADRETFASSLKASGKTLEQVRSDMDAAARQSACSPGLSPFIAAGGALVMTVVFPDGSPYLDSVYDRC